MRAVSPASEPQAPALPIRRVHATHHHPFGAQEDQREFGKLIDTCKAHFNDGPRINWGGHILGPKSQHKQLKRERAIAKELAQRATV